VTWKLATTLDGRSAAADGTSRWITSKVARVDSHRLRAQCDVMLIGSNTVAVDDPRLTVRDASDQECPRHRPELQQPHGAEHGRHDQRSEVGHDVHHPGKRRKTGFLDDPSTESQRAAALPELSQ